MPSPSRTALPTGSSLHALMSRIDYADAFQVTLARPLAGTQEMWSAFTAAIPMWARLAMVVRNRICGWLGLRKVTAADRRVPPGGKPGELVWGVVDKHLSFASAFVLDQRDLRVETAVRYEAVSGRLYFALVAPFHRLLIRQTLARLASP
jgi:hypothetical protein